MSISAEHLHDFYIEVMHTRSDKSAFVCHHQIEAVGAFATFKCPKVKGRFVRIRKQPPVVKNDVLTLCEVEVKGEEVGKLHLSNVYVCLFVCMYVRTYASVCLCERTYVFMYTCIYVCNCVYVQADGRVFLCVCIYVCVCV